MICIIGAGLAGDAAASTLRAEGYAGPIVMFSDEPHEPYDRPPLSKQALVGDMDEEHLLLRPHGWYRENQVDLRLGVAVTRVDAAERMLILSDGASLNYDQLLLATGSRARSLPVHPDFPGAHSVIRTLDDMRLLRTALQPGKRVVVVGAGVIGLETAASAAKLGCEVDVVELADRALARVIPPEISRFMEELHRTNGVRLHFSVGSVVLTGGGVRTSEQGDIAADVIVIGIGILPNTELAADAGLLCDDGVIVDEYGRTSDPHIFAAGDVARHPCPFAGRLVRSENWKHAQNHAIVVAKNMLGHQATYDVAQSMWSDQYDIKLVTVGHLGEDAGSVLRGDPASAKFMHIYRDEDGKVVGAVGVNSARDMKFAQMLVEKRAVVAPELLADPKQDLRKLAA